jgi:hypothetical protein
MYAIAIASIALCFAFTYIRRRVSRLGRTGIECESAVTKLSLSPGEGISRRGAQEEAPFSGDVIRKMLDNDVSLDDGKSRGFNKLV